MIYNVKDFGAKGNGITNDRSAIQQAIDTAEAQGGGTVYIPKGIYSVSGGDKASDGAIILRSNVTLEGAGMGETILKLQDGWNEKVTGIIRTKSNQVSHDIIVRDLTIDGNHAKNPRGEVDGFFIGVNPNDPRQDHDILVERVEIHSVSRYGFDPHEQAVRLTIRDSVAHHNKFDGFTIDYISESVFENNVSYANGRHGFNVVTSSHDLILKNNIAYGNGGEGIVVQRGSENRPLTHDIEIIGGEYYNNQGTGILVKMSYNVNIVGAKIHHNGLEGIWLRGTANSVVANNNIYANSQLSAGSNDAVRIGSYDDTAGVSGKLYYGKYSVVYNNILNASGGYTGVRESDNFVGGNYIVANQIIAGDAGLLKLVKAQVTTLDKLPIAQQEAVQHVVGLIENAEPVEIGVPTIINAADTIVGTVSHDTIYVVQDNLYIATNDGNDKINALGNQQTVSGGNHHDTILSGEGDDFLFGDAGNDVLNGNIGNDHLEGGLDNDVLYGGYGEDILFGGDGDDKLVGDASHDFIVGGEGDDALYGGSGHDTLKGGSGNDRMWGDVGDDVLYGGMGDDVCVAGNGNDTLIADSGSDILYGGYGVDLFVWSGGIGISSIRDFKNGLDVIDLTSFNFLDVADVRLQLSIVEFGNKLVFTTTNSILEVYGLSLLTFDASDVIL